MRISNLFLLLTLALCSSCSFLFDLSADQCQVNQDCDALGGAFTGRQCIEGVCEGCKSTSNCVASRGEGYICKKSSGQSVGVCQRDATPTPSATASMSMLDADSDATTDAVAPTASATATASAPVPMETGPDIECETNVDCRDTQKLQNHICRDNKCVDLTTFECPVVLQSENLYTADPIIVGAYSAINSSAQTTGPITLNYDLALKEFTDYGGLLADGNGNRRQFVAVVCEGRPDPDAPIEVSLDHLINTVKVQGIVASILDTAQLQAAFKTAKAANVLFIDPLYADTTLTLQNNGGMLWFILGEWRSLAPAYVELTQRAEDFQKVRSGDTEVRVALIQGALTPQKDISQVLQADDINHLVVNGKSVSDEANLANFQLIGLKPSFPDVAADVTAVVGQLQDFKPHIIVLATGVDFIDKVLGPLEATWDDLAEGQVRPFYVLSPDMVVGSGLDDVAYADVITRAAGVNFEGYADRNLYIAYRNNFNTAYGSTLFYEEHENFYDAMYYLLYAVAASGLPPRFDGTDIAIGMRRLVAQGDSIPSYKVGFLDLAKALSALNTPGNEINLKGTMGPSNFYTNGTRVVQGSVWCIKDGVEQYNVLRLDSDGALTGTFPCFDDF
jgi:hypothetical protein